MEWNACQRKRTDPASPMLPTWYGTVRRKLTVGDCVREVTYYIPDGATASTAGVLLVPDSGTSADMFLRESIWPLLADTEECREKFILCVLEDDGTAWHTGEAYGAPDGDVAYVRRSGADFSRRDLFCVHEAKVYIVGFGAGAVIAQMAAMADPAFYAGLACVDSGPVSKGYRVAAGSARCINLSGFEDCNGRLGIHSGEVPLPVWLISSGAAGADASRGDLDYWCRACGAEPSVNRPAPDTTACVRRGPPADPLNQDRAAHRVWSSVITGAGDRYGWLVSRRIWKDFLSRVRRWRSEPGGSLRMTEDPVRDLHCAYRYEQVGGWMREWYIYAPRQIEEHPEIPVPVVFASHGYTCTGEIYLGNSGWNRVADKYGFLVVAATAPYDLIEGEGENEACKFENTSLPAWNIFGKPDRPDEIAFFRHMLADLKTHYAVDEERIFATGHSWGSMMTQYLGLAAPELFAAIAPCSGVLFDEHDRHLLRNPQVIAAPEKALPVWMVVGEREPWLFPHLPEGDNAPARNIRLWWERYRMGAVPPRSFETGWQTNGRWHDLTWQKDGIPMLRYTWVAELPHATMPEMSERIWLEFFAGLRRERISGESRATAKDAGATE